METLDPMYPGKAGSPTTRLAIAYVAGVDSTITVNDASVLPAPGDIGNLLTIRTTDLQIFSTVHYTGKSGNVLSGLTLISGAASGTVYPIGTQVSRVYTAADHQALINNAVILKNGVVATEEAAAAHVADKANPHDTTKDQVGLGAVDNTSDADKPISTAQQSAIEGLAEDIAANDNAIATLDGDLEAHQLDTDNPHQTTLDQLGAAPLDHADRHKGDGDDPIPVATTTVHGLMPSTDKSKLDGVASGAQVNVLEAVKVGGTALPITSKAVDIPKSSTSILGVVKVGDGLGVDGDGVLSVKSSSRPLYGLQIDWLNDNPATCCKYTRGSVDRTAANGATFDYVGDWDLSWLFSDDNRYWVMLHNITSATLEGDLDLVGTENYLIDPTNNSLKKTGGAADLSGADGDFMTCFRCNWDKYYKDVNSDEFVFSDQNLGDGWYARPFEFGGTIRDRVYVGSVHGSLDANNRLRSIINYESGLLPLTNVNIVNAETYCTNNNPSGSVGYSQWNWNLHAMMQKRFWLKYKSLDSQASLGYGYCNATTGVDPQPDIVGGSFRAYDAVDDPYLYGGSPSGYDYGLVSGNNPAGTSYQKTHMRFDGIDGLCDNVVTWCKGAACASGSGYDDTNYHLRFAPSNADAPSLGTTSWRHVRTGVSANTGGYIDAVSRDPVEPIAPHSLAGASNISLCDYGHLYSGYVAYSGGAWGNGAYAGVSRLAVYTSLASVNAYFGARLVYYPPDLAV